MKKAVLLDTNITIGLLNDNVKIVETIESLYGENVEFYFSVITKCELLSGAKNDQEMKAIMRIENNRYIDVNNEITTKAGEIRREQKQKQNRVIKTPDSLIAATAIVKKYDLYTLDKGMIFASQYGVHLVAND